MPVIPFEEYRTLPNVPAVYIIRSATEVLYVGSSIIVSDRIYFHKKLKLFKEMAVSIEYIECDVDDLAKLETLKIRELLPILNIYAVKSNKRGMVYFEPFWTQENTTLRDKVIKLLNSRSHDLTLKKISKDTNIKEAWLSMLGRGKIPNPGVNNIQVLYEYFTKTKINI